MFIKLYFWRGPFPCHRTQAAQLLSKKCCSGGELSTNTVSDLTGKLMQLCSDAMDSKPTKDGMDNTTIALIILLCAISLVLVVCGICYYRKKRPQPLRKFLSPRKSKSNGI